MKKKTTTTTKKKIREGVCASEYVLFLSSEGSFVRAGGRKECEYIEKLPVWKQIKEQRRSVMS